MLRIHSVILLVRAIAGLAVSIGVFCVTCLAQQPYTGYLTANLQSETSDGILQSNGNNAPIGQNETGTNGSQAATAKTDSQNADDWLNHIKVGYDGGFLIASTNSVDLQANDDPFRLKINGWGQLRHDTFDSNNLNPDRNQFQLKRARIVFSGHAFTNDFSYFFQLDGRSSSGDDLRLLDYYLSYDLGHHALGLEKGRLGFRTGKWKMPFHLARYLSGREFEFTDRSMASTYFDVNRSLAWGLNGRTNHEIPMNWEVAIFNGLVTGGAETGSSGSLDNNFAYSARAYWYPTGEWGVGELADFECHTTLASRVGAGFASSTINESGSTEFQSIRVVDSGRKLSSLITPLGASQYNVDLYSIDASFKYRGWSMTTEYYFRQINHFEGAALPNLFDHGMWFQLGKFVVPDKCQLLTRWSWIEGNSGTLGANNQSAAEVAGGFAWYFREQNAKLVADFTHLDGAPINSSALGISPGDAGWLFRTQLQFAF